MGPLRGWALLLLMPGLASAEEEAGGSQGDKALGLTMMGAIFMIMGMFYLANWPDHDIRKITWSTINNTISIFCAVILFKNVSEVSGLLFSSFTARSSLDGQLFWNRVFTMFWYCCLFFSIFCWSGGLGRGLHWRRAVIKHRQLKNLSENYSTTKPSFEQMSGRMKACLCLAHTTGFAGLYGWGMKTNTAWYKDDPWHCAWLIPKAIIWYYMVVIFLMLCRRWLLSSDFVEKAKGGRTDRLLARAEEQLEDGENDFLGLFLSFIIVTTIRFGVGGHLPNEEGEEGEFVFKHTPSQVAWMYVISVVFFFCALGVLRQRHFFAKEHEDKKAMILTKAANPEEKGGAEEEEEAESEEEVEAEHVAFTWLAGKICSFVQDEEWHIYLRTLTAHMMKRLIDIGVNMLSFSFAWCFMYATQWLLAPFFDKRELVLGIVLAIVITILSCILVYILDKIADDSEEESARALNGNLVLPEEEDVVCRKLMESTGILIGFVWEQCFDVAVAGVAGEGDLFLKPCLALLTVVVILPVWLWYIIPMEISGGYILGMMPMSMSWRLKNMHLDAEPNTRAQVKEQLQGVLSVVMKRDPKLLEEVLTEWNPERDQKSLPYQPPPAVLEAHVSTTRSAAAAPRGSASLSQSADERGL